MSSSNNSQRDGRPAMTPELKEQINIISEKCINCNLCRKECEFLRKHGKPKEIADSYEPDEEKYNIMPFECSLCRLCEAVCPVNINPAAMFLEMRRESVSRDKIDLTKYSTLLTYEKRGASKLFSYYALPENCSSVLFPGCSLPGTRPGQLMTLYEHMKKHIPELGIALDCCNKPSHDLGREEYFKGMFAEMVDFLKNNNIKNIFTACPNCYRMFSQYGDGLVVETIYRFLAENFKHAGNKLSGTVTVHDPCALRHEKNVAESVRTLITETGLNIIEMQHCNEKTLCCGEGGAAGYTSPDISGKWGRLRKTEAGGNRIITYCVGCANHLNPITPASHILDLLYEPEAALSGKAKVSKSPITYLNRIRLKRKLKRTVNAKITRERRPLC